MVTAQTRLTSASANLVCTVAILILVTSLTRFAGGGFDHHGNRGACGDWRLGRTDERVLSRRCQRHGLLSTTSHDQSGRREPLGRDGLAALVIDMDGQRVPGSDELGNDASHVLHLAAVGAFCAMSMLRHRLPGQQQRGNKWEKVLHDCPPGLVTGTISCGASLLLASRRTST